MIGRPLAARLGLRIEAAGATALLASCDRADAALQWIEQVRRLSPGTSVRAALRTADCTVARYFLDGQEGWAVIGREVERIEAALREAAPGSVVHIEESDLHLQVNVLNHVA